MSQDILYSLKPTSANSYVHSQGFLLISNDSGAPKSNVVLLLEGVSRLELEASQASVAAPKSFWFS